MTAMLDTIENLLGATVQHGPLSDRVYVLQLGRTDPAALVDALERLAGDNGYGKIIARLPVDSAAAFFRSGYRCEARIPGFYRGQIDGVFMSRYRDPQRRVGGGRRPVADTRAAKNAGTRAATVDTGTVSVCAPGDAEEMSRVYRQVFASYPFPIQDPRYLAASMASHTRYFCLRHRARIVALSAAEVDSEGLNAEMTDFAVLRPYRGQRLASRLLERMEREMHSAGMQTAYTIARTRSTAMTAVFRAMGYVCAGILPNNTHIAGGIETMAVWYKTLAGSG